MSEGKRARAQQRALAAMKRTLDWAYDHATEAIPGIGSAKDVAAKHLKASDNVPEKAIDNLIAAHTAYAGVTGFVTNLGGVMTLPVSIPANVASVLALQLRLIAAIAHLRNYDPADPRVRTMAFLCLTGSGAASVLEDVGVSFGTKLTGQLLGGLSSVALKKINHVVGARLTSTMGASAFATMGKALPIVGAVVGGAFDAAVTRGIGAAAKSIFVAREDVVAITDVVTIEGVVAKDDDSKISDVIPDQ
ncbi:MAG TPA: EcsC family protein [Magnetospirillaceae bacterium]|jgi:hypothetical protein